jgi:hypothetical protein
VCWAPGDGRSWEEDPEFAEWLSAHQLSGCTAARAEGDATAAGLARAVAAGQPIVLRGMPDVAAWPALNLWADRRAFRSRHGSQVYQVRWPVGARQVGIFARNATLAQ